jgi:hypothetical protein
MMGKPCLKGTRIPVYLILEKLGAGETRGPFRASAISGNRTKKRSLTLTGAVPLRRQLVAIRYRLRPD